MALSFSEQMDRARGDVETVLGSTDQEVESHFGAGAADLLAALRLWADSEGYDDEWLQEELNAQALEVIELAMEQLRGDVDRDHQKAALHLDGLVQMPARERGQIIATTIAVLAELGK